MLAWKKSKADALLRATFPHLHVIGGPVVAACVRMLAAALLLCAATNVHAQQRLEIRSAYVEPADSVYLLNVTMDFDLPEGAKRAIREGVALTLDLEIAVSHSRRYWFDDDVASLEQRYELLYHALSERYLVRNLNSGEQSSFANLDAALDHLRVVDDLPVLDGVLAQTDRRHDINLRASLDVRTMPDTLRFVLFWADDWRQRSEWYTWSPQL
jgi:Domain of unknown function (DUF4390)